MRKYWAGLALLALTACGKSPEAGAPDPAAPPSAPPAETTSAPADGTEPAPAEAAPAGDSLPALEGGTEHEVADKGFAISFPNDWKKADAGAAAIAFHRPPAEGDAFVDNVNVVTEELPQPMTVTEYTDACINGLKQATTDYEELERHTGTINGADAVWVVVSYALDELKTKSLVCLLVKDNTGYVVTCMSAPDKFDGFRETHEQIAGTFRFL